MSKATPALISYIAQQITAGAPVVLDEMIFADIPGLSENNLPDSLPPASQIVHRQAISQTGRVNDNAVVYSVTMGTEVGNFEFNFIGLINRAKNMLGVAVYTDRIRKTANFQGMQGNAVTRSVLLEFDGASALTNITIPAETWQIDFTQRLIGLDEKNRFSNLDLYGRQIFFNGAGKVTLRENKINIAAGTAYIAGLRVAVPATEVNIKSDVNIWLDVCDRGTVTGAHRSETQVIIKPSDETLTDYRDNNGVSHYVVRIANISADGKVRDLRTVKWMDWALLKNIPQASLTDAGITTLYSGTDSDKEDMAATPKAVRRLKALIDALTRNLGNYIPNSKKSSSVNSYSEDTVATSKAVKNVYDFAAEKTPKNLYAANLNTLSGSQFFGATQRSAGIPAGLSGEFDLNGIHAEYSGQEGRQAFQLVSVGEHDVRYRMNDDGTSWTGWTKLATESGNHSISGVWSFPVRLNVRSLYSTGNNHIDFCAAESSTFYAGEPSESAKRFVIGKNAIEARKDIHVNNGGDYSCIKLYNSAGKIVRFEATKQTDNHVAALLYQENNGTTVYRQNFPKKGGTLLLDIDVSVTAADKIVRRDGYGNIWGMNFRSAFADQSTLYGAVAFRGNNDNDNGLRFCSDPQAVRGWLGLSQVVQDVRLGAQSRVNLTHSANPPMGHVVTRVSAYGDIDKDDFLYYRPLQKYINGQWVTVSAV